MGDHNLSRMHEDHSNASKLADGLVKLGLHVVPADTNMVFFEIDDAPAFVSVLGDAGIRVLCTDGKRRIRAVANLHVTSADIDRFISVAAKEIEARSGKRRKVE